MRRKRCPYCKSLNTAEVDLVKKDANKEYIFCGDLWTCDDCDSSFDQREYSNKTWTKIPNEVRP